MRRFWYWLRAEWATCRRQAECPHLDADPAGHDECPDCGYDPFWQAW